MNSRIPQLILILLLISLIGGVQAAVPVANFAGNVTNGTSPLSVLFTDSSTNTPTGWAWYFGDEIFTPSSFYRVALTIPPEVGGNSYIQMAVLADGTVLISGGGNSTHVHHSTATSSDGGATWSVVNDSYVNRYNGGIFALSDGSVIQSGGTNYGPYANKFNTSFRSTNKGVTWVTQSTVPGWDKRDQFGYATLPDDSIYIIGGYSNIYLNDVWRSTDKAVTWTEVNSSIFPSGRIFGQNSVTGMPNGKIVVVGGDTGSIQNDVRVSSDQGATWSIVNTSAFPYARYYNSLVCLPDNTLVISGGYGNNGAWVKNNETWISKDIGVTWQMVNASSGYSVAYAYGVNMASGRDGSVYLFPAYGSSPDYIPPYQLYKWNTATSTAQNPTHTFTGAGQLWNITQVAFNADGYNITKKSNYISTPPVASFTPVTSTGTSPLGVTFTDTSTNTPTAWNWTIEGKVAGNTTKYLNASTAQNPSFTFLEGNFTISLGAGNAAGYNVSAQKSWVNVSSGVTLPIVQWITDKTTVLFPGRIYFNDTSLNTPTQWNWSFGDGTWYNTTSASLGLNKSYQYVKRGVWVANLTVGNSAGTNTSVSKGKSIRVIGYQGMELPEEPAATPTIWDQLNFLFRQLVDLIYCIFSGTICGSNQAQVLES